MTASEITILIGAISVGIVNIVQAWWNGKNATRDRADLKSSLQDVAQKVDGLGDARDAATQKSAFAQGVLSQRESDGQPAGPISP
jgi:hypothetical protein